MYVYLYVYLVVAVIISIVKLVELKLLLFICFSDDLMIINSLINFYLV